MSQLYYGLVTATGLAKLAASAAGGPSLTLSTMAFGDGGGAEVAPTTAASALVNERYRAMLVEKYPHPTNPSILYVEGIIPPGVGGWTMREAGIYDAAGDLIVIAKTPALNVALISEGASTEGVVRLPIIFDSASSVQILVDPTVLLATQGWVLERVLTRPFITVDSATTAAPPANPPSHALYRIPAGATGAWVGHDHKLAYYASGWRFYTAPVGKRIAASDTGKVYRRVAAGWEELWVEDEVKNILTKSGIVAPPGSGLRLTEAVRSGALNYAVAAGTANAVVATLDPALAANVAGMRLCIKMASANTGAATLNAGAGALPIRQRGGADVAAGAWQANDLLWVTCTGTAWQVDVVGPSFATLAEMLAAAATNRAGAPDTVSRASQWGVWNYAAAGGTENAITAVLTPPLAAHVAGMAIRVKIATTNTGPATLNAGPGHLPIVTLRGEAVSASDLPAGAVVELVCTGAAWMLVGQAYSEIGSSAYAVYSGPGTYTWVAPARVSKVKARLWGGGGGGGGAGTTSNAVLASGAGGGAYGEMVCAVVPGQSYTVIVGAGGIGGAGGAAAVNGATGGLSSFGAFVTALGGSGGLAAASGIQPKPGAPGAAGAADYARPGMWGGLGWPSTNDATGVNVAAQGGGAYQTGYTATYIAGKGVLLVGAPGNAPAGGGGGGMCGGAGGKGADGMVLLEY